MGEGKEKKILGVIGGMGPEATSYFYENVIAHTKAQKDQDHINMVILSHADIPDRTEAIKSGDSEKLVHMLQEDAGKAGGSQYCHHLQYIPLLL